MGRNLWRAATDDTTIFLRGWASERISWCVLGKALTFQIPRGTCRNIVLSYVMEGETVTREDHHLSKITNESTVRLGREMTLSDLWQTQLGNLWSVCGQAWGRKQLSKTTTLRPIYPCGIKIKQMERESSNGRLKEGHQGLGHIYPPVISNVPCQANPKKRFFNI